LARGISLKQSEEDEYIDSIHAAMAFSYIKLWSFIEPGSNWKSFLLKSFSEQKLKNLWDMTLKLVDNPYFERTWIVQEIVLATRARVLYRTVEIDWETFSRGAQPLSFLAASPSDIDKESHSISRNIKLSEIWQIEIWRKKRQQAERIPFSDAVFYLRRFQATDLRDKIFGVLGLCDDASRDLTTPDYSKELADVYLDATRRFIREEGIPRLFFAAGIGYFPDTTPGLERLPSWAPDWSRTFFCIPFSYFPLRPSLDYSAGGDALPESNLLVDNSLFLTAHFLDTVAELSTEWVTYTLWREEDGIRNWTVETKNTGKQ
jgi:hypothetical protein